MKEKMVENLKKLAQADDFVVFSADEHTFVQVKYYPKLPQSYRLNIPLNKAMKKFEQEIGSLYDSKKLVWKKIEEEKMEFMDTYLSSPEKTAEIAELVFKQVFKKDDCKVQLEVSAPKKPKKRGFFDDYREFERARTGKIIEDMIRRNQGNL